MKRILFYTFVLLLSGCSLYEIEYIQIEDVLIPPYKTFTLDNGLKIVLLEYHRLPLVELQMTVSGGTSIDPDTLVGLASMTTTLMRQGTITRTATQISDQVDFIGATLNTSASKDYSSIGMEFLKNDIDKGIDLFSDIIRHPSFPQEEIERERSLRIASLETMKENPQMIANMYIDKLIYKKHPYGNQAYGTTSSLSRITQDELIKFYNMAFTPNNSLLVIVGDFSTDEMLGKIKLSLGKWKKGPQIILPTKKPGISQRAQRCTYQQT